MNRLNEIYVSWYMGLINNKEFNDKMKCLLELDYDAILQIRKRLMEEMK